MNFRGDAFSEKVSPLIGEIKTISDDCLPPPYINFLFSSLYNDFGRVPFFTIEYSYGIYIPGKPAYRNGNLVCSLRELL